MGNRKVFWVRMTIGLAVFVAAMFVPEEAELFCRAAFAITYLIFVPKKDAKKELTYGERSVIIFGK